MLKRQRNIAPRTRYSAFDRRSAKCCDLYQFFCACCLGRGLVLLWQVTKSQGEGAVLGFSTPLTMHCNAFAASNVMQQKGSFRRCRGAGVTGVYGAGEKCDLRLPCYARVAGFRAPITKKYDTMPPFYIALCLLCSVDIFIAYAMSFFCFSIFMINNDLYSVMIIL